MSAEGNDKSATQPKGYPLGALFVLVSTCAVLAVAVAPLVRDLGNVGIDTSWLVFTLLAGGLIGGLLGGVLGLLSFRHILGGALGGPIGLAIGLVAGLMVHTPEKQLPRVALAMLVGSSIVVVLAFWMRRRE